MRVTRFSGSIFALLGCSLIFLLAACGGTSANPTLTSSPTTAVTAGKTATAVPTITTQPVPPVQTSCPPQGSVRAAVTAPLALGKDPNIVYLVTEYNGSNTQNETSTLKRYGVTTAAKTEIVKIPGVTIGSPQVSADGQWILFVTIAAHSNELQMVRMDGQGLQTLYCFQNARINNALWSSNQQKVLFSASAAPNGFSGLYLANIANGTIEQILKPVNSSPLGSVAVNPITWLDNTKVYVSFSNFPIAPDDRVGLLDTSRGTQTVSDLTTVYQQTLGTPFNYPCYDADSSYDATTLYISQCSGISAPDCSGSCALGTREGPTIIFTETATGGSKQTFLTNQSLGIAAIRTVTSNTLLLQVDNFSENHTVDSSQNGLWKVNANGSGLTRLTTDANDFVTSLCQFSQNPWSNVSRDGSMYAFGTATTQYPTTDTLAFGQMSGGNPQTFASITGTKLQMVGWTTV
ncbi:MAG TPA: hypothetical protein VKB35_00095 [Ktedonobacteraceae bacterium]|nr:hypothetical protein [Ktedonobacteraceae bacterium]